MPYEFSFCRVFWRKGMGKYLKKSGRVKKSFPCLESRVNLWRKRRCTVKQRKKVSSESWRENVIKESYSDSAECAGKCKHSKTFNSEKLRDVKERTSKVHVLWDNLCFQCKYFSESSYSYPRCPRKRKKKGREKSQTDFSSFHNTKLKAKNQILTWNGRETRVGDWKRDQKFVWLYDGEDLDHFVRGFAFLLPFNLSACTQFFSQVHFRESLLLLSCSLSLVSPWLTTAVSTKRHKENNSQWMNEGRETQLFRKVSAFIVFENEKLVIFFVSQFSSTFSNDAKPLLLFKQL